MLRPETGELGQASWSRIKGDNVVFTKGQGEYEQLNASGQCSEGDKCSFKNDEKKRAKPTAPPCSRTFDAARCEKSSESHKS